MSRENTYPLNDKDLYLIERFHKHWRSDYFRGGSAEMRAGHSEIICVARLKSVLTK